MNVLIACERSGIVREAFNAYSGVRAMSCDLAPCEDGRADFHLRGNVFDALAWKKWDLVIAHPPCTFLSVSGLHWNGRVPGRHIKTIDALEFVARLMNCKAPHLAIENPVGCISTRIGSLGAGMHGPWTVKAHTGKVTCGPAQTIQPYQFGDNASKRTCLWLKNLPALTHTQRAAGRLVEWPRGSGHMVERWENQTDSGQNRLGPSETRAIDRARTYPGIAAAMAAQWVPFLLK